MKKRILSTLLGICMILSLVQMPAFAATDPDTTRITNDGNQLRWSNTATITLNMSYSRGTISWSGSVLGKSDVTKISVTYTLYKQNSNGSYSKVDSWTDSTTSSTILVSSGSATGTAGTYKLTISGTVTAPGGSESVSTDIVKSLS